jgi:hypothetical protein
MDYEGVKAYAPKLREEYFIYGKIAMSVKH